MEGVGAIFTELVKCMSSSISECWKYHRGVKDYMVTLKKRSEELNSRKGDIEERINLELVPGETKLNNEVELWFQRVEDINVEIKEIEEKVKKVKFGSRADLGKIVDRKIKDVEELYSSGVFPGSLVIPLLKRGDELPTTGKPDEETTFIGKIEEIWENLIKVEVSKIGVYGMGGIGKTTILEHINNRILERNDKFDNVIWVTVTKDSNILNLQDKIAQKLGLDISNDNDEITRAGKLHAKFGTKKRYVLILDDLWEAHPLKVVGIPEPTIHNGCKLVLTTRSLEVCNRMSCKPIKMELLSADDALDLFLDMVDYHVISTQNLEPIVKEIVQQCAGLPLAIVTIASSLKGTVDLDEWEIALKKLKECLKGSEYDKIFERLKFSYDRLNDKRLQDCLLYCALFPEDHEIERAFIIEHLIVEKIIEEQSTRRDQIKIGQVMLNKLVNVCLLNDTDRNARYVKMHDLVRDMAIRITGKNPRFLVKAGLQLKSIPDEENWEDDIVKVSLMGNNIVEIPPSIEPPKCPKLCTLLLSQNTLRSISDNFFQHMMGLRVLDLSYTRIKNLPKSVSCLVNLTALLLTRCEELKYVPSLANLKGLRKLDFFGIGIYEVPHGLEMLVGLRYLDFSLSRLKFIPDGILRKLVKLQYLSLMFLSQTPRIKAEELSCLRKLETFYVLIDDIHNFNAYVRSLEKGGLSNYVFICGSGFSQEYLSWIVHNGGNNYVYLRECNLINESILLNRDVEKLRIEKCKVNVSSLCELMPFLNATKLRCLEIQNCQEIEYLSSYSYSSIFPRLQSLERLDLDKVNSLLGLFKRERFVSIPPGLFFSLKYLRLCNCNNVKKLFILNDASTPNLEEIVIEKGNQLEELISTISHEEGGVDRHLPKLRSLHLSWLPNCSPYLSLLIHWTMFLYINVQN